MQKTHKLTSSIYTGSLCLTLLGAALLHFGPRMLSGDDGSAKPAAPKVEPVSQEALDLVHEATNRLFAHKSVQAKLLEKVNFGDRSFTARGSYLAGEFPKLRLEYEVSVGTTRGNVLEVCDGQLLRTLREIRHLDRPEETTAAKEGEDKAPDKNVDLQATRRDVRKMIEAARTREMDPDAVLQVQLGLGGLPALLGAFEQTMVFHAVKNENVQGRPFRMVQARWNDQTLQVFQAQLTKNGRNLPIPDLVRIYFDAETLFPTYIHYLKRPDESGQTPTLLLSIEFQEIELNGELPSSAFELALPAHIVETDLTEEFVDSIKGQKPTP